MAHVPTILIVFATLAFWALRRLERRPIDRARYAPPAPATIAFPPTPPIATRRRPPPTTMTTVPMVSAPDAAPRDYLLGGRQSAVASDRVAALMATMSGPGVCTPPNP